MISVILAALGICLLKQAAWMMIFVRVTANEYLELLTFDWQETMEICQKMKEIKKGLIDTVDFYHTMSEMMYDDLVERDRREIEIGNDIIVKHYYRLTSIGMRRIKEKEALA